LKRAQLEEHVTSLNSNERRENASRSSVADTDAAHARAKQLEAQLRDVKQRATSAATEGGKRIKAAETELMKMRRAVDAANAARAAGGNASREFELRMRDKDAELDTMRGDLREARETARANASLAVEAATRLKSAELVVTRAREAAETAATRARVSKEGASKAGLQAAAAAREKENAVRVTLAEAESRYEKFAQEARKASEEAAVAAADRDGRVELLERSLVDLETKARDAVTAAENAVFSATGARNLGKRRGESRRGRSGCVFTSGRLACTGGNRDRHAGGADPGGFSKRPPAPTPRRRLPVLQRRGERGGGA